MSIVCPYCKGLGGGDWPEPGPGGSCEICKGSGVLEEVKPEDNQVAPPATPAPNAPDPRAFAEELSNYLIAHSGGKLSPAKAFQLVQAMLAIQMRYYEQFATPEVTEDVGVIVGACEELAKSTRAIIFTGASLLGGDITDKKKLEWQQDASNLRSATSRIAHLLAPPKAA